MRLFIVSTAALVAMASPLGAACLRVDKRSPDQWAKSIDRASDVIMDAEVVREQDVTHDIAAQLRPITVYKGQTPSILSMSLPPSDGHSVTERYDGFSNKYGERLFLILYSGPSDFKTSPCDYVVDRPMIRQALLKRLARRRTREPLH